MPARSLCVRYLIDASRCPCHCLFRLTISRFFFPPTSDFHDRGVRRRKPSCRTIRRHCRTPRSTSHCCRINAASVLPSQTLRFKPKSLGVFLKAASICAIAQPPRTFGALPPHEAGQAFLFEPMHPVGYGSRRIAKQSRKLSTAVSPGNQQGAVQPMVIARLRRPTDLIPQRENDTLYIGYRALFHSIKITDPADMRN